MYADARVGDFINSNFIPVRIHVKEQPAEFKRWGAEWTPTIILLDPDGTERHRIEGFLPADDFLAQLKIGLAHSARLGGDFVSAEKQYRELMDDPKAGETAPEAQYWAGVSRYKANNDPDALADTARAFKQRFQESPWAKKASVWG